MASAYASDPWTSLLLFSSWSRAPRSMAALPSGLPFYAPRASAFSALPCFQRSWCSSRQIHFLFETGVLFDQFFHPVALEHNDDLSVISIALTAHYSAFAVPGVLYYCTCLVLAVSTRAEIPNRRPVGRRGRWSGWNGRGRPGRDSLRRDRVRHGETGLHRTRYSWPRRRSFRPRDRRGHRPIFGY